MENSPFLKLDSLSKFYHGHKAVDQVSLNIPKGQIFGLLGPNGAGKTTIIRMITHIMLPDKGNIYFDGEPLKRAHLKRIGYLPEERGLYRKMKVREQLSYLLVLKGMEPKEAKRAALVWLDKFQLGAWANRRVQDLSKGMQQKVQFIATVGHKPDLLILDEPFSGLDPVNTRIIEQEILTLQEKGSTIIFSTHRMEQVEELCHYIALINQGKCILNGSVSEVRKKFQKNQFQVLFRGNSKHLYELSGFTIEDLGEGNVNILLPEEADGNTLLQKLSQLPLEIQQVSQHVPRLNDIFIHLVDQNTKDPSTEDLPKPIIPLS